MPVAFHPAANGVPDCFVLLLEPDWSDPVQMRYALASEQAEGLSGIEYRVPAQRALRLRQQWTCTLEAADAAALREALASLGGYRVGCPIWPDAIELAGLHAGQRRICWNDSTGAYAIDASPTGPYPHPRVASLLVGRLAERPVLRPIGGGLYVVTLTVQEDSPFDLRIDPAAGSTPDSFIWEPDWSNPIEDYSRDQLRSSELGQGREAGVAGAGGTPRWGESAGFTLERAEAAALLRFWLNRRGSVDSFAVPAWGRPGNSTALTPDTYQARFDADTLEYVFLTPTVIEVTVKLWQQVTLSGSPPPSQAGAARAHCFTFRWEGATTLRWTSWEHAISHLGDTWTPARVAKSQLRTTMEPFGDECDVVVWAEEPGNPLQPLLKGEAERRLSVEVAEVSIDASGAVVSFTEIFTGEVRSAQLRGDRLVGRAASFGGVFARKVPRFFVQVGCNYSVFSVPCGLLKAAWGRSGPLSGTFPGTSIGFSPSASPTGAHAQKWFALGWLEVLGTDGVWHRRAVLDSSELNGTWTLRLNRDLPPACAAQIATVYPGCDGQYSTCKGKFANGANFGGHPFAPAFIATSEGVGGAAKVK